MPLKKLLNTGFIAHSRAILGVLVFTCVLSLIGRDISQELWAVVIFNIILHLSLWLPLAKYMREGD